MEAGSITLTEQIGAEIARQLEAERDRSHPTTRRRRRPGPPTQARYF